MDEGQVAALLEAVDRSSGRFLLGVTGPPGSGKSTIAALIETAANEQRRGDFAVVAPMDGFHLSNDELAERGLLGVKGAPETFDVNGFVQAVERMRADPATTIPWPGFDRSIEQTVPGAIAIRPSAKLVVVEGNYLLLDDPAGATSAGSSTRSGTSTRHCPYCGRGCSSGHARVGEARRKRRLTSTEAISGMHGWWLPPGTPPTGSSPALHQRRPEWIRTACQFAIAAPGQLHAELASGFGNNSAPADGPPVRRVIVSGASADRQRGPVHS